jgi:hypothetical protein
MAGPKEHTGLTRDGQHGGGVGQISGPVHPRPDPVPLDFLCVRNGQSFFRGGAMMRRCLDCPTLIAQGSRCGPCQRAHERARGQRRPSVARHQLPAATKARDGYCCRRCGSTVRLEAHHVRPRQAGGRDDLTNMITLCQACHQEQHGESPAKAT